jgi:aspartate/methionine/tyrosine aminotransferase
MKLDTKNRIAKRMCDARGEAAFQMLGRATELERQGRSIIHLEIGEPDFDTPKPLVDAGIEWLKKGATHYSPTPGLWDLRTAIARHLNSRHPVTIDPKSVLTTPGAKMMIFTIIQCVVDPGDEVICPDPGYPAYEAAIRMAGATPVPVQLWEFKGFRFDLDELARRITPRTKMIVINSPQNPTGGVLTLTDLKRIADLADKHDLLILSDEIYSEIYYAERPASVLDVPDLLDRVFFVNGFSKIYAMTGWRLGYSIVPEDTASSIELFINNTVSSTATFTQRAAIEAFTPDTELIARHMVEEFRHRRDVFVDGLNSIPGIRCSKPLGAFYLFPNIIGTGLSSEVFINRLLNEAGVAALAGTAFGQCGEGYIRFSFANSFSNIESAIERIRYFVKSI